MAWITSPAFLTASCFWDRDICSVGCRHNCRFLLLWRLAFGFCSIARRLVGEFMPSFFAGRSAARRHSGRAAFGVGLSAIGADSELGRGDLRCALGASQGRRGHRVRAGRDHCGGFGRHVDFRRTRHDSGNCAGHRGNYSLAKWPPFG